MSLADMLEGYSLDELRTLKIETDAHLDRIVKKGPPLDPLGALAHLALIGIKFGVDSAFEKAKGRKR